MDIEELSHNRILLRSKKSDPKRKGISFVLMAETKDEYREWVDKITNIIRTQRDFLNAIQDPIAYEKGMHC